MKTEGMLMGLGKVTQQGEHMGGGAWRGRMCRGEKGGKVEHDAEHRVTQDDSLPRASGLIERMYSDLVELHAHGSL